LLKATPGFLAGDSFMTARRIARELAVIMMPQLPRDRGRLEKLAFDTLLCRSVQMLTDHARQCLSEANGYLLTCHQELDEIEINHPDNISKIADVKPVKVGSDELKRLVERLEVSMHLVAEALDIPEMAIASDYVPENVTCQNCGTQQKLHLKRVGSATVKDFVELLLGTYLDHRNELDRVISSIKTKWRIERMVSIDRDILRLASTEAFYLNDIPVRVAVSEAVELAHRFADDKAAKFINGILADLVPIAEHFRLTGELNLGPLSDEGSGRSEKDDTPVRR
jgi:transcription antitermination factor NusB